MITVRVNGAWNLIEAATGCLICRGTFADVTTALKEYW